MEIENLIEEMKAVKLAFPDRSLDEILKLFNIQALRKLTTQIRRMADK